MIVVLPFCHKDYARTREQLRWMAELDGVLTGYHALLVASSQTPDAEVDECVRLAKAAFGKVSAIRQREVEESGWPKSCNRLFQLAAAYVHDYLHEPFYWMENDVVPLRPGWLQALDREYQRSGQPFMGVVYDWVSATRRLPHLTGCAIYPADLGRYNRYALVASDIPWDCTRPELTLPHVHRTSLMCHRWGDRVTNVAPTFPSLVTLGDLPPEAVVFHRCKDGSLINRLRERRVTQQQAEPPRMRQLVRNTLGRSVRRLLRGGSSYYHSGNLGDIVYALCAIKLHGGGDLFIGPQQNRTSPCAVPISQSQFELLRPLLALQPYLHRVGFEPTYPHGKFKYDLNTFRNHWNDWGLRQRTGIDSLCEMHCHTLGVRHLLNHELPWLTCGRPITTDKVIVHRSARYRATDFPWQRVVDAARKNLLFVGTETEHRDFEQNFGKVSFYRVRDFEDLAKVIAGGISFVGNQSFPCSLALAQNQFVVQESWSPSPDCVFHRKNFLNQHSDPAALEDWLSIVC